MKYTKLFFFNFTLSVFCFLIPLIYYHLFDEQHNSMGAGFRQAFLLLIQFLSILILFIYKAFKTQNKIVIFKELITAIFAVICVNIIYYILENTFDLFKF